MNLLSALGASIALVEYLSISTQASPLEARQSTLPAGWQPFGCFSDTPASRTLKIASFDDVANMTIEECIAFCGPSGFLFAGVEFARECFCDNIIEALGAQVADSTCDMSCTGDTDEICGGSGAISIFQNTAGPKIKQLANNYSYVGCYQDGVNGAPRSLQHQVSVVGGMSAEKCAAACKAAGFVLAGLEFGQECWCDSYFPSPVLVPDTDCNIICTGDNTELCGAGNRLAIYQDTTVSPLNSLGCLTCAQLHINPNPGQVIFNLTAQPFTSAAVPTAGAAPFQIAAQESFPIVGQPIIQLLGAFTGTRTLHTFTMSCDNGQHGFLFDFGTVEPQEHAFAIFPENGRPLEIVVGGDTTPSFCSQPNPLSKSSFIGPPVLAIGTVGEQWGFCGIATLPDGSHDVVVFVPEDTGIPCPLILLELNLITS